MVPILNDDDSDVTIDSDSAGLPELTSRRTKRTKLTQEVSFGIENLDPMIVLICDNDPAVVVNGDVNGKVELSISRSKGTNRVGKFSLAVDD